MFPTVRRLARAPLSRAENRQADGRSPQDYLQAGSGVARAVCARRKYVERRAKIARFYMSRIRVGGVMAEAGAAV